ncbi:hypothetical protein BC629DRAFT_781288 [Irpex lacteus]|nr:hypothetical protein BC629DRAFT_781288 [Irpex lacteus]
MPELDSSRDALVTESFSFLLRMRNYLRETLLKAFPATGRVGGHTSFKGDMPRQHLLQVYSMHGNPSGFPETPSLLDQIICRRASRVYFPDRPWILLEYDNLGDQTAYCPLSQVLAALYGVPVSGAARSGI